MSKTAASPAACADNVRSTPRTRPRRLPAGFMPAAMAGNCFGLKVRNDATLYCRLVRLEYYCNPTVFSESSGKQGDDVSL